MSRHHLLLNPNTREALTAELVAALAPAAALPLHGITASFGEPYIASEVSYAVAGHAALQAWRDHTAAQGPASAVLVACFGDPGVPALREAAGVPVIGLAEAAMREAAALGRFGIVTGGPAWNAMLRRLAGGLGIDRLADVEAVPWSGGQLSDDPTRGVEMLQAGLDALLSRTPDLAAVVVGGAALGGFSARLRAPAGLHVIDSLEAGGRWLARAPA
jgi:Asp/Glu/hydantoin racemase